MYLEGIVKHGYKFVKKLGSGGAGQVWKATKDGNLYAIKIVKKDDVEGDFANNMKQNSPFLVRYYETFSEDVLLIYIVMEYFDGGDLYALVQEEKRKGSRFSTLRVKKIFIQLILALNDLHKNHILHRDIKLENVLLKEDGILKLGDFGCFKMLMNTDSRASTFKGTIPYMAPEFFRNQISLKSDVWAFGVLMYHVCTFQLPFRADNQFLLPQTIMNDDFEPIPTDTSLVELIDSVHSMLSKNESDRPSIPELMNRPFVHRYACEVGLSQHFIADSSVQPVATPTAAAALPEKNASVQPVATPTAAAALPGKTSFVPPSHVTPLVTSAPAQLAGAEIRAAVPRYAFRVKCKDGRYFYGKKDEDVNRVCNSDAFVSICSSEIIDSAAFVAKADVIIFEFGTCSVTKIGNSFLSGCSSLTTPPTIPNSVTNIGNSFLSGCSSLTAPPVIPSTVRVGSGSLDGCTSLKRKEGCVIS